MTDAGEAAGARNRIAIAACIMLVTVLSVLDTAMANLALPHIQGRVADLDDNKLTFIIMLVCMPLLLLMRKPWRGGGEPIHVAVD